MRRLLLVLAVILLLTGTVWADGAAVTEMKTECTVSEDGSCAVVLHVRLNLAADEPSFSFPIAPNARDISVTGADCRVSRGGKYTVLTFDRPASGKAELTVSYRLDQTVTDLGSGQRLDLTLLYPDWPCPVNRFAVQVTLPKDFESVPTILSGYYGDLIDNYLDIQISDGVIRADLNETQTLQDHEAIRISLDLPENYFDLRYLAGKTVATDRLLFLLLLVLCVGYWLVFLRARPIRPKRQAMPPEGSSVGAIPYAVAAQKPDLALMVVQWASLGYLTISRSRGGRILLNRQIDMGNERREFEIDIFRALFRRSDCCGVRGDVYRHAKALCEEKTANYWKGRIFSRSGGSPLLLRLIAAAAGMALCVACFDLLVAPRSWRWFAIAALTLAGGCCCWLVQRIGGCLLRRHSVRTAVLALAALVFLLVVGRKSAQTFWMLLCVLLQLAVGFALRCGGKRTKAGRGLASELLGYRRYLVSVSTASVKRILNSDPQYYYRCLPYAEALRVDRVFTNSFEKMELEPCDWLEWEGKPAKTARAFYVRYVRLMAGLRGEREPLSLRLHAKKAGRRKSAAARRGRSS